MIDLRNLTYDETEEVVLSLGEPKFRAKQIFSWVWRGARDFDEMTDISKSLRSKLAEKFYTENIKIQEK